MPGNPGTAVHLLGRRLSALDFVARFIIRGRFIAVVFSRGVRSRAAVRVRAGAGAGGSGVSLLPGTARRVRFVAAGRLLRQAGVSARRGGVEESRGQSPRREPTSSDPLLEAGLCFCCWSCCFLSMAERCTARILGLDFQNCDRRGQRAEWVSVQPGSPENFARSWFLPRLRRYLTYLKVPSSPWIFRRQNRTDCQSPTRYPSRCFPTGCCCWTSWKRSSNRTRTPTRLIRNQIHHQSYCGTEQSGGFRSLTGGSLRRTETPAAQSV